MGQRILKNLFDRKLLNERELVKVWMAEDQKPAEVLLENYRGKKADK